MEENVGKTQYCPGERVQEYRPFEYFKPRCYSKMVTRLNGRIL